MWPFRRHAQPSLDAAFDEAVALAAAEWRRFEDTSDIPRTLNLRDRVPHFAVTFRPLLMQRLPVFRAAPDETILLVIAEGIAASGAVSRRLIELQLGIVLPSA